MRTVQGLRINRQELRLIFVFSVVQKKNKYKNCIKKTVLKIVTSFSFYKFLNASITGKYRSFTFNQYCLNSSTYPRFTPMASIIGYCSKNVHAVLRSYNYFFTLKNCEHKLKFAIGRG